MNKKAINWQLKDTLVLLVIPLEFLLSYFFGHSKFVTNDIAITLFSLLSKLLSFVIVIWLFGPFLKVQWQLFKRRLWLKILIAIGGTATLFVILSFVRSGTRLLLTADTFDQPLPPKTLSLMLLATFPPLLAPFVEELIFRHILLFKFRSHKTVCFFMLLLTSFLFGALHFYNFGGNILLTVPYMVASLFFGIIYLVSQNIWYSLSVHLLFNFTNSLLPTIFFDCLKPLYNLTSSSNHKARHLLAMSDVFFA